MTDELLSLMRLLPVGFEALEPFADWIISNEKARYAKRFTSSLCEITAFYECMLPLLQKAMQHTDAFSFEEMPADVERLYWLLLAMMEAGLAIEIFHAADVPNAVPAERISILAPEFHPSSGNR